MLVTSGRDRTDPSLNKKSLDFELCTSKCSLFQPFFPGSPTLPLVSKWCHLFHLKVLLLTWHWIWRRYWTGWDYYSKKLTCNPTVPNIYTYCILEEVVQQPGAVGFCQNGIIHFNNNSIWLEVWFVAACTNFIKLLSNKKASQINQFCQYINDKIPFLHW